MRVIHNKMGSRSHKLSTGLVPVSGYEPWSQRTLDSIRDSIAEDIPILARLHSAADYPCDNFEKNKKLDMESHAVLIVGYDDTKEEFLAVDPWHEEWQGEGGGVRIFPYSILHKVWVNCSADKCTRMAEPDVKISVQNDNNGNHLLNLRIGFYTPRGYIMDKEETEFTSFEATVFSSELGYELTRKIKGNWHIGEFANIYFPIEGNVEGANNLEFSIKAEIRGSRPYQYNDTIEYSFNEIVEFAQKMEKINGLAERMNVI